MSRIKKPRLLILGVLAVLVASVAAPAWAADNGTIDATVSVEGPCIEIGSPTVDFGAQGFSTTGSDNLPFAAAVSVTNCSASYVDLYATASDASNLGDTVIWSMTDAFDPDTQDICPSTDTFAASLGDGIYDYWLSKSSDTLVTQRAHSMVSLYPKMAMPCSGSHGSGQVMSFTYTVTAILSP